MLINAQKSQIRPTGECISALMLQGHIYFDFHTTLINASLNEEEKVKGGPWPSVLIALVSHLCQRPTLECDSNR